MKWITLFTFLINNIFILNITYAEAQNQQSREDQEKERFKQEAQEIYKAVGVNSRILPYEAFLKGYIGYFKHKNKLNGLPIITFVNFSIPSNENRLVTIDFKARTVPYTSIVAHGMNSRPDPDGSMCTPSEKNPWMSDSLKGLVCPAVPNSIAKYFSTRGGDYKSAKGLMYIDNYDPIGLRPAYRIRGLDSESNDVGSRGVLFHGAEYPEAGASSAGCFVVPNRLYDQGAALLKNKTLLYAFEGTNLISSAPVRAVDEETGEEIPRAVVVSSQDQDFTESPDVTNVKSSTAEFKDLEIAKAPTSKGGLLLGIAGIAGAYMLATKDKNDEKNEGMSTENLVGSPRYEECQQLSSLPWSQVVQNIKAGQSPSSQFTGSWSELHKTMANSSIENEEAVALADERTALINECVAIAHISTRTDFTKKNINQPETKSSSDNSITCKYDSAESQDYQPCLSTIEAYDQLRKDEVVAHNQQASNFQATSQQRLNQVTGDNAQAQALSQSGGLQEDHSNIALERAEISRSNIQQLSAIASKIPTLDSLYDECKENFAKHGTVSVNEYNQFTKIYLAQKVSFTSERDFCLEAVSKARPVTNQSAREQIKAVLKKLGGEMEEYTSKSQALKNRTAQTPTMDSNAFTRNLTDLKFTSVGNGAPVRGYGRDGSLLLQNSGVGSNNASGSFGSGGLINAQGSNTAGVYRRAPGMNGADTYSTSGGSGSMGNPSSQDTNSAAGSGIYDEEFHRKINAALQSPEKVAELNLSPEQMKEYIARRDYNQLMAQGSSNAGRDPASSAGEVKDERPVDISAKEMNIFDIISSRYAKEFSEDL
jgi:hypothetical protein